MGDWVGVRLGRRTGWVGVRPGSESQFDDESLLWQRDGARGDDEPLKLSLDEAIRRGLETNLGLKEAESGEKLFQGEKNSALQEFLPTINLSGGTGVFQHNLAAQGFGPGVH